MIFLGWLNTCVRCDHGERDRAASSGERTSSVGQKPEEQTEEQRQRTRQYNYYYNNFIVNKKQYILRFSITCILYTSGARHDAHAYS